LSLKQESHFDISLNQPNWQLLLEDTEIATKKSVKRIIPVARIELYTALVLLTLVLMPPNQLKSAHAFAKKDLPYSAIKKDVDRILSCNANKIKPNISTTVFLPALLRKILR
jgi:hypothetical protein